jgi:hypothetical protein
MPKPLERRSKRRNYRNDSNTKLMNMMTMPAPRAPRKTNQRPSNFKLRPAAASAGKRNSPPIRPAFDPIAYAAALEVLG